MSFQTLSSLNKKKGRTKRFNFKLCCDFIAYSSSSFDFLLPSYASSNDANDILSIQFWPQYLPSIDAVWKIFAGQIFTLERWNIMIWKCFVKIIICRYQDCRHYYYFFFFIAAIYICYYAMIAHKKQNCKRVPFFYFDMTERKKVEIETTYFRDYCRY